MIAAVIRWSVANRFLVVLATLALAVGGALAVRSTPVDALPDLSDVQVVIRTSYPGQAPQIVEDQVTYPLTTTMLSVPGARTVRGYSFFGDSFVYIIFEDGQSAANPVSLSGGSLQVVFDVQQTERRYWILAKTDSQAESTASGAWHLWIVDEANVARGKEELAQFLAEPNHERYSQAAQASGLRRQEAERRKQVARNVVEVSRRWNAPLARRAPVTMARSSSAASARPEAGI